MKRAAPLCDVFFACATALSAIAAAAGGIGCSEPGGPGPVSLTPDRTDAGAPDTLTVLSTACPPARGSEDLRGRITLTGIEPSVTGTAGIRVVKTSDLFGRFNTTCGQCHVATANGGKHTSAATFAVDFDMSWLDSIYSEDPKLSMPPDGKFFSKRADTDPVRRLVAWLTPWMEQGRPTDAFVVEDSSETAAAAYAYTAMTNIGTCVPGGGMYAASSSTEMEDKDALFESLDAETGLPPELSDTDLTTFDSDVLAANGVVSFVPTYPLWSDGSGKLRHIRVPKGKSVVFDKDKQTFSIPPNTRFYKTFFRQVIDGAGRASNRKIETRLIVSRADTVDVDGKTPLPTALYGTYVWSDDESTATLLTEHYRDNTRFADKTIQYVTDEIAYRNLVDSLAVGAGVNSDDNPRLVKALKAQPDLLQHYAIPGAIRCVQCHQGSPSQSFVLGFTPLQLARRETGTGGTYEPTGADELNQLQRFIDYGLISGMKSPADVVRLEDSQAPRKFRTDGELKAQAYMIGNCAHCHNPRGFPSLVKPELAGVLNFLPTTGQAGGGIFEFPLDKMSPVRSRGADGDVQMPYITPSLRDYPVANLELYRMDNGAYIGGSSSDGVSEVTWTPKYDSVMEQSGLGCRQAKDKIDTAYCRRGSGQENRTSGRSFIAAPWRSLLYRNVDAPFPYFDDYVPFPHMPMNSPGFDCRAPRIMGDWMVGLPAARKRPDINEDALPKGAGITKKGDGTYDDAEQPYVEVKPGDPGYAAAQDAARNRLAEYHDGARYTYCETVLGKDILDPVGTGVGGTVAATDPGRVAYLPDPNRYIFGGNPVVDPIDSTQYVLPVMGVPYHSHWFNYDPTDAPGDWSPRRATAWKSALVERVPDEAVPAGQVSLTTQDTAKGDKYDNDVDNRRRVVEAINQSPFSDAVQTFALTEVPYGLWLNKPECQNKLATMRKAGDPQFSGSKRPLWMDRVDTTTGKSTSPDAPVFMMSPGAALYRHICFNCHGPKADGHGLQGDALAASSEGLARPANFMAGLFGPLDKPGANINAVFGGLKEPAATWGSRYMAWMALGGTLQLIPKDIIHQVEATRVLGKPRPHTEQLKGTVATNANMLNLAKGLCSIVLPDQSGPQLKADDWSSGGGPPETGYPPAASKVAPFITANYDWEMWMNLCSRFSPPVVRVYGIHQATGGNMPWVGYLKAIFYADGSTSNDPATIGTKFPYPANAPVLDHNSIVRTGVHPDNYYPACVQQQNDPMPHDNEGAVYAPAPDDVVAQFQKNSKMPFCPPGFLAKGGLMWRDGTVDPDQVDNLREWTLRGAIAAGMSVFAYLRTADLIHTQPLYYNECQLLP